MKKYSSTTYWKDKSVLITGVNGFIGSNLSKLLISLGAKVIEKHVTLNKNMNGTDHLASIDMVELKKINAELIDLVVVNLYPFEKYLEKQEK